MTCPSVPDKPEMKQAIEPNVFIPDSLMFCNSFHFSEYQRLVNLNIGSILNTYIFSSSRIQDLENGELLLNFSKTETNMLSCFTDMFKENF